MWAAAKVWFARPGDLRVVFVGTAEKHFADQPGSRSSCFRNAALHENITVLSQIAWSGFAIGVTEPGFPVDLRGATELHAAFRKESRVPRCRK